MSKLALITGGAHPMGIGYASAKALLKLGYEVIVTGISDAEIAQTPALPDLSTRVLDVTSDSSVASLIASLSRLDALVNCAGTANLGEFEVPGFQRTVDVNLVGTMRVSMAAYPLLARQGGAVVNIGSMYSIFGSTMAPGYAASKGGVVQLTKSFAASWGKDNIRVNAVAPGWIKTNMSRMMWEDEAMAAPITARTPMGRWGDAAELGDVIGFLCAPESRFVTGVLVPVDGGYSISG
jgi:NAD(P)-dependent dehydrogenase (short-subunit alcohol dehydrogenase family)